jgi:nucleotide-binding universal stress UspA family protein
MLTDAFIPLLTYPQKSDVTSFRELSKFLDGLVTHVTYCAVEVDIPNLADRWGAKLIALPQMVAEVEERSRSDAREMLAEAERFDTDLQVETRTRRALLGDVGLALAREASSHDLAAMVSVPSDAEHRAIAEDLLFHSGRPLLLVPSGDNYAKDPVRIAVAWDGSQVAYSAIHEAMPWLVHCLEVTILTASHDKKVPESATVALEAYFSRHGVRHARADTTMSNDGVGADLQRSAIARGAEMLVMGAYGHTRLREFLIGGATAGVLERTLIPVLMAR